MKASIRMVCGGCLRSVEVSEVSAVTANNPCPYCGGPIDTQSSQADPREDARAVGSSRPPTSELGEAIDWAQTWARGSFGSLGRFQLREKLGDGGFGHVFRAYDPRLDRDVAVKILKQPNPAERVMERFFREARAVARLDHPNIVAVHDAGFDNGRCWVAYQLVIGRPLWWYREHHPMDAIAAAQIIRSLADALDHSHHQGVVHRDIKPANVLVDDRGRPRLIDFGLARRSDFESDLTRDGAIVGTPAYMSPEQALGRSRQADERSDVYSLGVILHELIFGRHPDDPNVVSAAQEWGKSSSAGHQSALDASRWPESDVPPVLRKICARATALEPSARHPTARALADDLETWLAAQQRTHVAITRPGMWLMATIAAALVLVGGLVVALILPSSRSRTLEQPIGSLVMPSAILSTPGSVREPSAPLVGNLEKRRYHRADCSAVHSIAERHRIVLAGPEEAAVRGFQRCEKCLPPVAVVGGPG